MSVLLHRSLKITAIVIGSFLVFIATMMAGMQIQIGVYGADAIEHNAGTAMGLSAIPAIFIAIGVGYLLYKAKYNWVSDKFKEIGVALALIVVVVGGTLVIDNYHTVSPEAFFMVTISLSFFPLVGWDYRKQFKSLAFALFFVVWMFLHGAVFVVVMKSYGWGGYFIAMPVELFIFYVSAKLIFGFEPPTKKTEDY